MGSILIRGTFHDRPSQIIMSVAASRLVYIFVPVFLGLTPQAMNMPPLRGFTRPPHEDGGDPESCRCFAAGLFSFVAGRRAWRPRLHISPLRGSGRSKVNRSAEAKSTWCRIVIEDERRRRDRFIAWGVSPRNGNRRKRQALEGRQIQCLGGEPRELTMRFETGL